MAVLLSSTCRGERIVIATRRSPGQAQLPSRWSDKGDVSATRWSRGHAQLPSRWSCNVGDAIATLLSRGPVMLSSTRAGERIVIATRWSRGQAQIPSRWSNMGAVIALRRSRGQFIVAVLLSSTCRMSVSSLRCAGLQGRHSYPRDGLIRATSVPRAGERVVMAMRWSRGQAQPHPCPG